MSRIGKMPVSLPKGVEATKAEGTLSVKGPKGSLTMKVHPDMKIVIEEDELRVERPRIRRITGLYMDLHVH